MKVDAFSFYVASNWNSIKLSLRRTLVRSVILLSLFDLELYFY